MMAMHHRVVVLASALAAGVASDTQCTWTSASGTFYDLTSMKQSSNDYRWHDEKYEFLVNVCADTHETCKIASKKPGMAVQYDKSQGLQGDKCFILGGGSPVWSLLQEGDPKKGVQVRYEMGEGCITGGNRPRTMSLKISCKEGQHHPELVKVIETSVCNYEGHFEAAQGCPANGGGGGWTFVFCVFFIALVYFGGGAFYRHKTQGIPLNSIEAIPNYDFWEQLPGLVRDGATFFKEQVQEAWDRYNSKEPVSSHSYQSVGS